MQHDLVSQIDRRCWINIFKALFCTAINFEITLMHGDSLCTDDLDYQSFRTVVRDEKWQIDFLEKEIN